jgi:hypothetical protein
MKTCSPVAVALGALLKTITFRNILFALSPPANTRLNLVNSAIETVRSFLYYPHRE